MPTRFVHILVDDNEAHHLLGELPDKLWVVHLVATIRTRCGYVRSHSGFTHHHNATQTNELIATHKHDLDLLELSVLIHCVLRYLTIVRSLKDVLVLGTPRSKRSVGKRKLAFDLVPS